MPALVVWITGLPAAGKTTLATGLCAALSGRGLVAVQLDGDVLRGGINRDLGFSAADRAEAARRASATANLLAAQDVTAVVSMVSPVRSDRLAAAAAALAAGVPWLELYVDTSAAVCHARDPKGLYARAAAGTLTGLTGWDAPYEAPTADDGAVQIDGTSTQAGDVALEAALRRLSAASAD